MTNQLKRSSLVFLLSGKRSAAAAFSLLCVIITAGCGGGSSGGGTTPPPPAQVATPTVTMTAAQNGGQVVTMADTTSGASIFFTTDGSTPTSTSQQYLTPVLIASNVTIKVVATVSGMTDSDVTSQSVSGIASGALVWSDEFSNSSGSNVQPDASVWTYDTGAGGWGNAELETYCAYGSTTSPCDTALPNTYVGTDGYLHVVARNASGGAYTSARLKTQGLFSTSYGRVEALIKMPEGQGLWPAFWMLGNNITTVNWPACGEHDIMEHINAPLPDWFAGSIHGAGNLNGSVTWPTAAQTYTASDWHIYGMIWSKGKVQYYIDDPSNVYASFDSTTITTGTWPFDSDGGAFIILNMAVGGSWPGAPDATTPFPSEMLVDYVRVYAN
ncbi:glycoside hydrolase, family 16 [Candidatus Koribacter versatilis Ellin345]|uniref:Glycoside hydrolase, family 16 n=1 Tax=Koribacter versatilis (strain Ellin345) TaxID=204669 RepID=Q1IP12_KORVE|nr:family 16 glycosylhydrolase [Candidatus Koribacter versatilis]ABF41388.1 glycoside hydrolase, family 16 [Candidatus Koribacter versatilis Ellin345]